MQKTDRKRVPVVGLDIGTTTISAVVLDVAAGCALDAYTLPNDSAIPAERPYEKMQDAGRIMAGIEGLLEEILSAHADVAAIGLTGQMHGIVYVNAEGEAVSPLYTWQDGRAGVGEPSACDVIRQRTGYTVAAGYGLATHLALQMQNAAPRDGVKICTIMDYVGMRLCGQKQPLTHASNGAALGLFSVGESRFDTDAVAKAGMDPAILPAITDGFAAIGRYRGIPVSVAIGDNQASFMGSVQNAKTAALANFGTGSQISLMTEYPVSVRTDADTEIRPYLPGQVLVSGSALCGGRAYALLEHFFRKYAIAAGLPDAPQYDVLNALAAKGMESGNVLDVQTTFCGTRNDPALRGRITGISQDNLTPEALVAGTLQGMAGELHQLFRRMPGGQIDTLILSGNAARKNPALQQMLGQVFGMPVCIPRHREEAAYGAAMFAARTAKLADAETLQKCIHYTQIERKDDQI